MAKEITEISVGTIRVLETPDPSGSGRSRIKVLKYDGSDWQNYHPQDMNEFEALILIKEDKSGEIVNKY